MHSVQQCIVRSELSSWISSLIQVSFDTYSTTFSENLQHQPLACIQAVNSSKLFWLSSMFKGKFKHYPVYVYMQKLAIYVLLQRKKLKSRISYLYIKWSKGSKLIWSSFHHVRDIKVKDYRWVEYPNMPIENFKHFLKVSLFHKYT